MLTDTTLTITDPIYIKPKEESWALRLFSLIIKDKRDFPFIKLSLSIVVVLLPSAIYLFIPGNFNWWLAALYLVVAEVYFLPPFILMLHNTSHRPLFKKKFSLLNFFIPWIVGPLVGQTAETYRSHHLGMHHKDGNLPNDLSSTMRHQRDSFLSFMSYFLRFLVGGIFTLGVYFLKSKEYKYFFRMMLGEFTYIALGVYLYSINPPAVIALMVIPVVFVRFALMSGNWGQHAFIDHEEPDNDYKSSISFINSPYNHRCFNDGYHIGHHLAQGRHWLDMPIDFFENRQKYIDNKSLVFLKVDYFVIYLHLMFKQYKRLAKHVVDLELHNPLTIEEKVELFKERLKRFTKEELKAYKSI